MNSNTNLAEIIKGRLALQSIKRFFEYHGIPPTPNFAETEKFKRIYSEWTPFQKKNFLHKMAGFKSEQLELERIIWQNLKKVKG